MMTATPSKLDDALLRARAKALEAQLASLDVLQAQLQAQRASVEELLSMTRELLGMQPAAEPAPPAVVATPEEAPEEVAPEEVEDRVDITGLTIVDAAAVVLRERGLSESRAPDLARWLVERGYREVSAPVVYQALLGATHGKQPKVERGEGRGVFRFVAQSAISPLDGKSMIDAARILARQRNTREVTAPVLTRWFEEADFRTRLNQRPKRPSVYVALQNAVEHGMIARGHGRGAFDLFPEEGGIDAQEPDAEVLTPAEDRPAPPEVVNEQPTEAANDTAPVAEETPATEETSAAEETTADFGVDDILNYAAAHDVTTFTAEQAADWVGCHRLGRVRLLLARETGSGGLRMEADGSFTVRP